MLRLASALLLSILIAASSVSAATVKIVAVGDSNTDFVDASHGDLPTMVTNGLASQHPSTTYTAANKGVSSTASDYALNFFAGEVTANNPQIVMLMIGTNDVNYNTPIASGGAALSNTSISAYKGNAAYTEAPSNGSIDYSASGYTARIQTYINNVKALNSGSAQAGGKVLLVLMTPPTCVQQSDGYANGYWRDRTQLIAIADAVRSLASSNGLPLVDVYNILAANSNWITDYMTDGIHMNPTAKQLVANAVVSAVAPYLATDGTLAAVTVSAGTGAARSTAQRVMNFR